MQIVLKAVVGLAVLMLATAAHADVIKGQVVTADGRPVSGADVAPFWQFDNHEITPHFGVATDEEGAFTLDWDFSAPQVILAMNADRTLGGLVIVQPPSDEEGTTVEAGVITLVPMVDLKGGFYCDAFESRPDWSNVYMSVPPGFRLRIGSCPSDDAEFWFRLPPGDYFFHGYSKREFLDVTMDLTLTADEAVRDLGTIKVEPAVIAKYYGKEPPKLTVTDARGVPKNFSLEDFRGKWTLLEFWGFW